MLANVLARRDAFRFVLLICFFDFIRDKIDLVFFSKVVKITKKGKYVSAYLSF